MHGGDDGSNGELPFIAEPQIDQHRDDRQHNTQSARLNQLAGDARTNHFDAAEFIIGTQCLAHAFNGGLLGGVPARLQTDAHSRIGIATERLHFHFAKREAITQTTQG